MSEYKQLPSVSPSTVVLYQQLRQFDTKQGKGGDLRVETNITHAVEKYWEAKRPVNTFTISGSKCGHCLDCGAVVDAAHDFCYKCGRRLQW